MARHGTRTSCRGARRALGVWWVVVAGLSAMSCERRQPPASSRSAREQPASTVSSAVPSGVPSSSADPSERSPRSASLARRRTGGEARGNVQHAYDPPLQSSDEARIELLARGEVSEVDLARGGRSVAFKLGLPGARALFKPEQSFAANWFSEVASYHLDRRLGLGRVPTAVGRSLPWKLLQQVAHQDEHADEMRIGADGTVRGAMIWWLPGKLPPISPPASWEQWLRNEPPDGPSPFQRRADYQKALARWEDSQARNGSAPPPIANPKRPAELSDLVLFDYLTANHDRWGGNYTNVRTLGKGGPLVWIDNANGFPPHAVADSHAEAKLEFVQRFRRCTLDAIEALELADFRAALDQDPLAPLLTEAQLAAFERRRLQLLEHVQNMRTKFGKRALPW